MRADDFISIQKAAEKLGVTPDVLYRAKAKGLIVVHEEPGLDDYVERAQLENNPAFDEYIQGCKNRKEKRDKDQAERLARKLLKEQEKKGQTLVEVLKYTDPAEPESPDCLQEEMAVAKVNGYSGYVPGDSPIGLAAAIANLTEVARNVLQFLPMLMGSKEAKGPDWVILSKFKEDLEAQKEKIRKLEGRTMRIVRVLRRHEENIEELEEDEEKK